MQIEVNRKDKIATYILEIVTFIGGDIHFSNPSSRDKGVPSTFKKPANRGSSLVRSLVEPGFV